MKDADPEAKHRPKMAGNCENGTYITKKYGPVTGNKENLALLRILDPN